MYPCNTLHTIYYISASLERSHVGSDRLGRVQSNVNMVIPKYHSNIASCRCVRSYYRGFGIIIVIRSMRRSIMCSQHRESTHGHVLFIFALFRMRVDTKFRQVNNTVVAFQIADLHAQFACTIGTPF